ncbi:MAG: MFS transporter, partial [Candidatus Bathyarchaeota archaeon]|nr:MFS transporter [Candidatus Bathyarchaeota archaeon]
IYMPAFTAIVADSMPPNRRGTGYGVYNTITSLPNIFSPLIGGICMDSWGLEQGLKIFLIMQIVVSIGISIIRYVFTKETINQKASSEASRRKFSPREIFDQPKPIQIMLWVAVIGSFSARLVMDFTNLYALNIIKMTNTELGFISTIVGIFMALLAFPGGMLSDKYGRKNNIMLSRITNPLTQWIIAYATTYQIYAGARYLNGIAQALGGGGVYAGGPSWNALIADIVPPEKRGTVIGTQNTLTALIGIASAPLGGWLWENISPQTPFMVSGVIGLIAAGLFWWGVDEPSKGEKLEILEKSEREKTKRDLENKGNDTLPK